jgi:heme-degrading monooxygenase HmoA
MVVVHDIFICKPGQASKFAKMFKEAMAATSEQAEIMTDMTGSYNKVVMVTRYDSLSAYEQSFEKYKQHSPEMEKMMKIMEGYHDMYLTGCREIYQTW